MKPVSDPLEASVSRVHAQHLRRLHAALMGLWAVLLVPTLLFWTNSVPFLVFVSLYANFVGHFSSWQAARSEESPGGAP